MLLVGNWVRSSFRWQLYIHRASEFIEYIHEYMD